MSTIYIQLLAKGKKFEGGPVKYLQKEQKDLVKQRVKPLKEQSESMKYGV